ncbi:MAG: 3'-5' exonuclease, partial [Gelidibacter sp.]
FRVYYEDKDIDRIAIYCEKDTIAVAQILLRLRGDTILDKSEIKHI